MTENTIMKLKIKGAANEIRSIYYEGDDQLHLYPFHLDCQQPALLGIKDTIFHVLVKAFLGSEDP